MLSGAAEAIDKAVEIAKREHKRIKLVQKVIYMYHPTFDPAPPSGAELIISTRALVS